LNDEIDKRVFYVHTTVGQRPAGRDDRNVNSTTDAQTHYIYDAAGHLVIEKHDDGIDGTLDTLTVHHLDTQGRRTLTEVDEEADASIDARTTYRYHDNDTLQRKVTRERFDEEGNAQVIRSESYNAAGRPTKWTLRSYGALDERAAYEYNTAGQLVREEYLMWPEHHDEMHYIKTYTYNKSGQRVAHIHDDDADGQPDLRVVYHYDEAGRVVLEESHALHHRATPERVEYVYDQAGRVVEKKIDWHADSHIDVRTSFTYDAIGNILTERYEEFRQGTVHRGHHIFYRYDCSDSRALR